MSILDQLITQCNGLPSLTRLTITKCSITINRNDADRLYNKIWSLSKLSYGYLDIHFVKDSYLPIPTIVSKTLRHCSIPDVSCSLKQLIRLFQVTPCLQYLCIALLDHNNEFESVAVALPITHFKLSYDGSWYILESILKAMPNLRQLTLEIINLYIDGYQWERLIEKYLTKLKVLEFKMRFSAWGNESKEIQSAIILDSFRTSFWTGIHQWFVRIHWYSSNEQPRFEFIDLFTLPYAFKDFISYTGCSLAKSTCPYDDEYWAYDRVDDLCYGSSHFTSSIMSRVRFSNIQQLSLSLPFNDQFLTVVSRLDRLTSLFISINQHKKLENVLPQLQTLLDRATHLHTLSVGSWSSSHCRLPLMEHTSKSIRKLDLYRYVCGKNYCHFDDEQCYQLCQSPLGVQCETLLIKVKSRRNIFHLVNNMPNLRALIVRCEDDQWIDQKTSSDISDDDLINWLKLNLPSSSLIMRDIKYLNTIRLWIR